MGNGILIFFCQQKKGQRIIFDGAAGAGIFFNKRPMSLEDAVANVFDEIIIREAQAAIRAGRCRGR